MKLEFAGRVDIGTRSSNDDRALLLGEILDCRSLSGESDLPAVAVVCDGCGGYDGGGVAAETVCGVIAEATPESLTDESELAAVLERARLAVEQKKKELPQFKAMCATVAGCVFCEDRILIFHAGDSRVYRFDGFSLARMTVDHSVVQEMVDSGQMDPEEARVHPSRSVIRRCIGVDCPPPELYVSKGTIAPGELYLLCSDGFWETMDDRQIRNLLRASQGMDLPDLARSLVTKALALGSDDNISVCLVAREA